MKKIKLALVLCGTLVSIAVCANGQGFQNFNFEQATGVPSGGTFGFLNWNQAAPGWSHSSGGDTSGIYYGHEHLGVSQYYLLTSATSPDYAPGALAGNYSLAFASGHQNAADFGSPWVNAYISQVQTVPVGTFSLQMIATGPFQVTVGGAIVPMFSLGGNSYGGDISAWAGTVAEVKIINTATMVHTPTMVDNIAFSPVPVPEPSSVALMLLGLAFLVKRGRTNHS